MGRVSTVDQVGVELRVDGLKKRSIKKASKLWALDLAIRMMDLTTLEGKDTPGKVRALCAKAMRPKPGDPTIPHVAAICVYPALVADAREALAGSGVHVASVATGFPSGQTFRDIKLAETRAAVEAGADEIDMVIDRGAFLSGDYATVFEEIVEVKEACGDAHLKVILETGELETYDNVRRASILAMAAGADFIKTSTGKVTPAATMPVTLVMLEAIRDFERATGRQVGMKPAGGIRTAKEAIQYLVILYETLGPRWMSPGLVPLRGVVAAQRRAAADRLPAQRSLRRPGRLHARLTTIPRLRVSGTHRRGRAGRRCAPRAPTLREAVDFEAQLPAGRSRDEQLALADRYREATLAGTPWLVDEIDGAAEGAGVDARALFAASIEEIWSVRPSQVTAGVVVDGRCSDLVAGPPATADGHLWVAHTNDLSPASRDDVVAIEWRVPDEPVVFSLGIGPWISIGWNSAGLSLTGNELSPNDEVVGVPRLLMVREQLTATIDGRGGGDGAPTGPGVVVQHGLRDGRTARLTNVEGSATRRRARGARRARSLRAHQPLRLCPDDERTRAIRRTPGGPRCGWHGHGRCSPPRRTGSIDAAWLRGALGRPRDRPVDLPSSRAGLAGRDRVLVRRRRHRRRHPLRARQPVRARRGASTRFDPAVDADAARPRWGWPLLTFTSTLRLR